MKMHEVQIDSHVHVENACFGAVPENHGKMLRVDVSQELEMNKTCLSPKKNLHLNHAIGIKS